MTQHTLGLKRIQDQIREVLAYHAAELDPRAEGKSWKDMRCSPNLLLNRNLQR